MLVEGQKESFIVVGLPAREGEQPAAESRGDEQRRGWLE